MLQAFLPLIVAKLATLKNSPVYFGPPCVRLPPLTMEVIDIDRSVSTEFRSIAMMYVLARLIGALVVTHAMLRRLTSWRYIIIIIIIITG